MTILEGKDVKQTRDEFLDQAETTFWEKFAKHNDDETGRDRYLEQMADSWDENETLQKELWEMNLEKDIRIENQRKYGDI